MIDSVLNHIADGDPLAFFVLLTFVILVVGVGVGVAKIMKEILTTRPDDL